MGAREEDLSAHGAAGRDGARTGMNPRKLPGLRPSPRQPWKLPVSEFIEDRYWKRFGGDSFERHPHVPDLGSRGPVRPQSDAHAPEGVRDAAS
jgi:hypothetical protein